MDKPQTPNDIQIIESVLHSAWILAVLGLSVGILILSAIFFQKRRQR